MKLFISGKFDDKEFIRSCMTTMKHQGHTITFDWTIYEEGKEDDMSLVAVNDIDGVKNCDCHIIIITDANYPYKGCFCELGCSLGLGKKIIMCNPFERAECVNTPFYYHPLIVHVKKFEEIVSLLQVE